MSTMNKSFSINFSSVKKMLTKENNTNWTKEPYKLSLTAPTSKYEPEKKAWLEYCGALLAQHYDL